MILAAAARLRNAHAEGLVGACMVSMSLRPSLVAGAPLLSCVARSLAGDGSEARRTTGGAEDGRG